nr:transporter [Variovorax paradoxus]
MAWSGAVAQAQGTSPARSAAKRMEALQQQLTEQGRQIEALRQQAQEQEARYRELQERLQTQEARSAPPPESKPAATEVADTGPRPVRVGVAPSGDTLQMPEVAPIFDQPGILTPRGKYVIEPSLQYSYASNNRVALVGYTVIPALLIGLIDVREVKRNILTAAVAGRWGVTNRFELEAKIPYVYRSDSTISRELFTGSANERVFDTSGRSIGDVELAARYQLNDGKGNWPYMIGSLRFKTRTGKDPFEVVTDCVTRCVGNTTGTGLPLDLPTGSGFYSLQTGLTWLLPTDPAVFFGSFTYTHNFSRDNLSRLVLNGEREFIGSVKPGNIFGVNFGMGLALNERSSFSVGVELNSIGKTKQNGMPVVTSVRTQLASLNLGYSYRLSDKTAVNVSVGAGLTRDTPDLTLTVRVPMSF